MESSSSKCLYKNFSLAAVQLIPFVGEFRDICLAKMAFVYSFARHLELKNYDKVSRRVCAIGEILAPNLNQNKTLNETKARAKFVEVIRSLLSSDELSVISDLDTRKWKLACAKGGFLQRFVVIPEENEINSWPTSIPISKKAFRNREQCNLTPELAMAILSLITMNGKKWLKDEALCMLLGMHLGFLNNGDIPNQLNDKIKHVEADLKINLNIRKDLVQSIYNAYREDLNDEVARSIFIFWDSWVPKRIRFFLQPDVDKPFNNLISINTIKKAILTYQDFPWEYIALNPNYFKQFLNISKAMALISGNPYYSYKSDLGIVKPENYENITTIAKEIIKVGKMNNKTTENRSLTEKVKELINNYFKGKEMKIKDKTIPEEISKTIGEIKQLSGLITNSPNGNEYVCTVNDIKKRLDALMQNNSERNYTFKYWNK